MGGMRRTFLGGLVILSVIGAGAINAPVASADDSGVQGGGEWADPLIVTDGAPTTSPQRFPAAGPGPAPLVAPAGASRYVSVPPERVLDSRRALGAAGRIEARQTVSLPIVGRAGVVAGATAVVLNLTITDAAEWGFVTAYPSGQALPDASAVNVERPGQTVANLVTVPIGADGSVQLYSYGAAHLIADVQGYYLPSTSAGPGRLIPRSPVRVLDTRSAQIPVAAGGEVELDLIALAGLPADTDSVAIKITVTQAASAGYWTAYPAGIGRPDVSNLNVGAAGDTIANQAIVRLTAGRMRIYSERGGHLIVDLVGSFSGPSAAVSAEGLFIPVAPSRLLDTRQGFSRPATRRTFEVPVAQRFGLPVATSIGAVVINATLTDASAGYVSVWPARTYRPNASSLNASAKGQTIASHVITTVSGAGFAVYLENGGHMILDISGWYIGSPTAAALPDHVALPGTGGPEEKSQYAYLFGFGADGVRREIVNPPADLPPVRWDPCRQVRYVVNLAGYPAAYRADIEEAIDRVASATGQTFVDVGSSNYVPQLDDPFDPTVFNPDQPGEVVAALDGNKPYDLIIALGNEATSTALDGGVVGRAFPFWASAFKGLPRYVQASVVIDVDDLDGNPAWAGHGIGQVLVHELGHVVGLAHIDNSDQIMYPYISGAKTFGYGDLRGLWQVGASRGCV
jgi:Matrixin